MLHSEETEALQGAAFAPVHLMPGRILPPTPLKTVLSLATSWSLPPTWTLDLGQDVQATALWEAPWGVLRLRPLLRRFLLSPIVHLQLMDTRLLWDSQPLCSGCLTCAGNMGAQGPGWSCLISISLSVPWG